VETKKRANIAFRQSAGPREVIGRILRLGAFRIRRIAHRNRPAIRGKHRSG